MRRARRSRDAADRAPGAIAWAQPRRPRSRWSSRSERIGHHRAEPRKALDHQMPSDESRRQEFEPSIAHFSMTTERPATGGQGQGLRRELRFVEAIALSLAIM